MAPTWNLRPVSAVAAGNRVRHPSGVELTVSRIEPSFLGRADMVALIEDTPDRWLKAPVPKDGDIEVWTEG